MNFKYSAGCTDINVVSCCTWQHKLGNFMSKRERDRKLESCSPTFATHCKLHKTKSAWKLETGSGKTAKKNQHARKVHKKNIESSRVAFDNWQRHQLSMGTLSLWVFAWNLYELINFANGSSLGSSTFAYLPEIFPAIFPVPKMRFFFYASDNFCHSCRTSNWDGATNDWTFPLARDTAREMERVGEKR